MTKEENGAEIGLITFRNNQKKEKTVIMPQPKADSIPVRETIQITETLLTEAQTSVTETVSIQQTPAEKPKISELQEVPDPIDPECISEIVPQTEIPSEKEFEEIPENIPQTDSLSETKSPSLPEPEFTIRNLDFTTRTLTENELPESLYEMADLSGSYAVLKKSNQGELLSRYPGAYYFNQYLLEMYRRARMNGTVRCYEYADNISFDFPIENEMGKERLFASFLPNTKQKEKWFFLGIRRGGKVYDLANLSKKIDGDYYHLQQICNLENAGINSQFELRRHVEDSFIKAAEEQSVYQYAIGNQIIIEYPIYLKKDNKEEIITITFSGGTGQRKWQFVQYKSRKTAHTLPEAIRIDEFRTWRQAEKGKQKKEEEQRKAKQEEAKYKAREAEKLLIQFDPFPVKKIETEYTADYYGKLSRFAYHPQIPSLFVPTAGINIIDYEEVLDCIKESFKSCNPYTDINYYTTPEGNIAELRVIFPQYSDKEIYAVFTENNLKQRQPWYLKRLDYNSKFRRVVEIGSIKKLFEQFSSITSIDKSGITTSEELEAYVNQRFMEAISSNEIYVYGGAPLKRAELPLHLKTESEEEIHAYLVSTENPYKWKFSGFKIRPGNGDERISISEEYKAECAARQAAMERKQSGKEAEEEIAEPVQSEKEPAKERGTTVLGTDGKPISLINFCKEIKDRQLLLLAEMAEEEKWGFTEERPFEILYKYLNAQFIRLGYEKKLFVRYTREGTPEYAAIHTGLFSRDMHEPIYAGFKATPVFSPDYTGPLWRLDGFCCSTEGGSIYDNITKHFRELPENVDFMRENGDYIPLNHYHLDLNEHITLKEEHILKERGYRLPKEFLRKVFKLIKDEKAKEYLEKLASFKTEEEQKEFWINTFSDYLEAAPQTYDKLLQQLQVVVEEAKTSNIRKPLPTYYPRDNRITWLLPLRFHEEGGLKNLALVVGRRDAGGYKGITLMNIENVYHKARVVENPDRSWLKLEILDNYVINPAVLLSIEEEKADYVSETYGDSGEEEWVR